MPDYRPLPDPPAPDPAGETVQAYGLRLIAFLIREDGCTSGLSDEQLETASYAGALASTAKGYDVATYDRISRIRHCIAAAIARRAAAQASPAPTLNARWNALGKPNEGPMAPLQPAPDVNPTPPYAYADRPALTPDPNAIPWTAPRTAPRDNIRF